MEKEYTGVDIESIAGVTDWNKTYPKAGESAVAVLQMTAEPTVACRGGLAAGVE